MYTKVYCSCERQTMLIITTWGFKAQYYISNVWIKSIKCNSVRFKKSVMNIKYRLLYLLKIIYFFLHNRSVRTESYHSINQLFFIQLPLPLQTPHLLAKWGLRFCCSLSFYVFVNYSFCLDPGTAPDTQWNVQILEPPAPLQTNN